jgi:cytosine/adenosine deaminase-related metal-dependent hydrolase
MLRNGEGEVASVVLEAATAGGARALGLPAGRIEVGHWGDLVVIDLEHPSIQGCEVDTLAEALVTGADNAVVQGTYVGGSWRKSKRY